MEISIWVFIYVCCFFSCIYSVWYIVFLSWNDKLLSSTILVPVSCKKKVSSFSLAVCVLENPLGWLCAVSRTPASSILCFSSRPFLSPFRSLVLFSLSLQLCPSPLPAHSSIKRGVNNSSIRPCYSTFTTQGRRFLVPVLSLLITTWDCLECNQLNSRNILVFYNNNIFIYC